MTSCTIAVVASTPLKRVPTSNGYFDSTLTAIRASNGEPILLSSRAASSRTSSGSFSFSNRAA